MGYTREPRPHMVAGAQHEVKPEEGMTRFSATAVALPRNVKSCADNHDTRVPLTLANSTPTSMPPRRNVERRANRSLA